MDGIRINQIENCDSILVYSSKVQSELCGKRPVSIRVCLYAPCLHLEYGAYATVSVLGIDILEFLM